MQYSGPGWILYNGIPVLEASSLNFQIQTDNKDVLTLLKGRAGHSRGALKCTLAIDNAIPQAGYEVDWPAVAIAQMEVRLGVKIANKTYNCTGDVRDVDIKSSVDTANTMSFNFHGKVDGIV